MTDASTAGKSTNGKQISSKTADPKAALLDLLKGKATPGAEDFKRLVRSLDDHRILAKVFLLEGTPHVFQDSSMKYVIFRERIADEFHVGSQDVRIVGSARLGFSPSPNKYGTLFSETSDVDVVIVSSSWFDRGSQELFRNINSLGPSPRELGDVYKTPDAEVTGLALRDWRQVKDAIRNYVYDNFNPGVLPNDSPLKNDIFQSLNSTSGLFLALEPQVFVSKIRGRIFRTWRAAENYYTNSLRELKKNLSGEVAETFDDLEVDDSDKTAPGDAVAVGGESVE